MAGRGAALASHVGGQTTPSPSFKSYKLPGKPGRRGDARATQSSSAEPTAATPSRPLVSLVTSFHTSPSSDTSPFDSSQSPSPQQDAARPRGSFATPWAGSHCRSNPSAASSEQQPAGFDCYRTPPSAGNVSPSDDDELNSDEEAELLREQEQELARRAQEMRQKEQELVQEEARRAEQMAMISLLRERKLLHVKDLHSAPAAIATPRRSSASFSLQSAAGDLCRDTRLELLDSVTPFQRQSKVVQTPKEISLCMNVASEVFDVRVRRAIGLTGLFKANLVDSRRIISLCMTSSVRYMSQRSTSEAVTRFCQRHLSRIYQGLATVLDRACSGVFIQDRRVDLTETAPTLWCAFFASTNCHTNPLSP